MPDSETREYNPVITGFSEFQGPMDISLNEAKQRFGLLPSMFGFLTEKKQSDSAKRVEKQALNLKLGYVVKDLLEKQGLNFKGDVYRYFRDWHRDLDAEFGVHIPPFFNLNRADTLLAVIRENRALIETRSNLDVRQELSDSGLIRKDILNSIPPDRLFDKACQMIERKLKSLSGRNRGPAKRVLDTLNTHARLMNIRQLTGQPLLSMEESMTRAYADEISSHLFSLHDICPLTDLDALKGRQGSGVEFEYATRDASYLGLGKQTRDCTADKRGFQADADVENIFWTVFSWILDRNYQILKVFYQGEFVMKVHLMPLFISASGCPFENFSIAPARSDYMILAVDAIETTLAFRGLSDDDPAGRLAEARDTILSRTFDYISGLADAMNIKDVYAEKFSNTPWVRETLNRFPEIFMHVDHILKIDQLEDVFYLAREISTRHGYGAPDEVFMEVQMKNTYLRPGYINKSPRVKSFALIRGRAGDGIPMKRIIGV